MTRTITILSAIIYVAIILAGTVNAKAQSLTFNQVLLVGNTGQMVPAGKVWKVENYLLNNSSTMVNGASTNCGGSTATASFNVTPPGGSATAFFLKPVGVGINATSQAGYGVMFPIWLPAGTVLSSNCASWYLSVIEFNIVP